MHDLKKLFNPCSIAIVGASPKKNKLGNVLFRNILDGGWKGKIYLINPKYKKIGTIKCYPSLSEIKKPVDLVLVAIPAVLVNKAIQEGALAKPKIENFAIISSGFGEIGKRGKIIEDDLRSLAVKYNLNILGPNCLGFINPVINLNSSFTSGKFKKGNISIVSQSGALAVALLDWTKNSLIGFSKVISIGNKTNLDESDIINFLEQDKDTEAIALYLEDIRDGIKFREIVEKFSSRKPIVILKAGKNKAGQKAISSHTGSLAQDDAVVSAAFEKMNIIEAKTFEDFQNTLLFLNSGKMPSKNEVVILTNAGGPGVLASDYIGKSENLSLKSIDQKTKKLLQVRLPDNASIENPIDIIGDAEPERFEVALDILLKSYPKNPLLLILTPQSQTDPDGVAKIILKRKQGIASIVTSFMGGEKINKSAEMLLKNGIPNFNSPEIALGSIEKMVQYSQKKIKSSSNKPKKYIHTKPVPNDIIQNAKNKGHNGLAWHETEELFKNYGIHLAKSVNIFSIRDKITPKLSFPLALKTDEPDIMHRFEKKAVVLNIKNEKELGIAMSRIKRSLGVENFIVQEMAKPGLEMIIGLKRDRVFGPVIVVGWGGILTEIFKDRTLMIPLLTVNDIKDKLNKLKISPILSGFRGENAFQKDDIIKIVMALQQMAFENPDIVGIDINPVILYNNSRKYQILDAKIYLL